MTRARFTLTADAEIDPNGHRVYLVQNAELVSRVSELGDAAVFVPMTRTEIVTALWGLAVADGGNHTPLIAKLETALGLVSDEVPPRVELEIASTIDPHEETDDE